MAEVPDGAELITDVSLNFPTIKVENIYILPGIPEIFRQKFLSLKPRFIAAPFCLKVVYTRVGEGTIAEFLNDTLRRFPELMLGSYPKIDHPEYMVKVTLESKDAVYVERALEHLLRVLPGRQRGAHGRMTRRSAARGRFGADPFRFEPHTTQ